MDCTTPSTIWVLREAGTSSGGRGAYLVLDAGVLALCIFTDENSVDVVIRSLEAGNRRARSDVGKEVERAAKCEVERHVSLADWSQGQGQRQDRERQRTWGSKRAWVKVTYQIISARQQGDSAHPSARRYSS